jgi:hypothetical protein
MALMFCPECRGNVSSNAPTCPHCGYEFIVRDPPPVIVKSSGGLGGCSLFLIIMFAIVAACIMLMFL